MVSNSLETFRLGERCNIKSSKRIFAREYVECGVPFWRSQDVIEKSLGVFQSFDLFITQERFEEISDKFGAPQQGDLLISSVGNRSGQPYIVQNEGPFYFKDGNILWASSFVNLDAEFLAYWFKSNKGQSALSSVMIGSAQKALTIDALRTLEVTLPVYDAQVEAVKTLKLLDHKITLNRQINQTLEQMARELFKSWFVDFDPVVDNALDAGFFEQELDLPDELLRRAEARKAVRAQVGFKPLPAATRQLFPAVFEPCDEPSLGLGGWVPKGWDIHAISDIAFINKDSLTKKNAPKKIKYVDLSNAKDGIILGIQEYSFEEAPSRARRVLKKRDTIFGMVRPANRSFAYVDRDGLTGSTGFVVISAKNKNTPSFIYQKLTSDSVVEDLIRIADGAAYPAIKPDDISELMTVVPNKYILDLFEKTIDGYRERVAHNLNNNEQLANLRDTLLPKLISGELSLDEFELTTQQGAA